MAGKRLQCLDIVRGLTVAGMIMVNNGHSGSFDALRHAKWDGLTLCDLVFPFFLFIMGVSMYLSFSGGGFKMTAQSFKKILKRSVLLLFIGLAINWFDKAISGNVLCFDTLRYWAVMQRIALCYFFVSLIVLSPLRSRLVAVVICLLAIYTIVLIAGNGYDYDASTNVLARVDLSLFGYDHIYHKSPVDPEGLVGTICAMVNVLLGFMCGKLIKERKDINSKLEGVLMFGAVILMAGYLLSLGLPLNKRVWSPSFALVTSGWCALLLAIVMRLTDVGQQPLLASDSSVSSFFKVFGVNALFLYVFSELLAVVCGHFGVSDAWFDLLSSFIAIPQLCSLCYALSFVAGCFFAGYPLWKGHIYIKL